MRSANSRSLASFTTCAAVGPDRVSIRMSRTPSAIKLNPLDASSNCRLLTPMSANNPSSEPGATCSGAALNASPISVTAGAWAPNSSQDPVQPFLCQGQGLRVAVKADQPSRRAQPPDDFRRVTRQSDRAVQDRASRLAPGEIRSLPLKEPAHGVISISSCAPPGGYGYGLQVRTPSKNPSSAGVSSPASTLSRRPFMLFTRIRFPSPVTFTSPVRSAFSATPPGSACAPAGPCRCLLAIQAVPPQQLARAGSLCGMSKILPLPLQPFRHRINFCALAVHTGDIKGVEPSAVLAFDESLELSRQFQTAALIELCLRIAA